MAGKILAQMSGEAIAIPASLEAYVDSRTPDVAAALRALIIQAQPAGLLMPVTGSQAALAGLTPCRFDAQLLLKREARGLSAVIASRKWSVTLAGVDAWVDVEWPSETMAMWLEGKPVRSQIDFPFLSTSLVVLGSRLIGAFRRFHCREDGLVN